MTLPKKNPFWRTALEWILVAAVSFALALVAVAYFFLTLVLGA